MKNKFSLKQSTLTKAKLIFNIHTCDAISELAEAYIVGTISPLIHVKGSNHIFAQTSAMNKLNTRGNTFELDFTIALRPYIYEDSRLQESKNNNFHVNIEISFHNITIGQMSYIQFYSSKFKKGSQMKPCLSLQFTTETFHGIYPRIVPNNFSTNINVNGIFNLNDSYVCGIASYQPHQFNLTSMLFTLPQKSYNKTYLVCEIPAIRVNLKMCSIKDDRDNWNRCYSDYIVYIMREVNVGVDPNGPEKTTKSFVPIVYSGPMNHRIIQVTDYRNLKHFLRSNLEWNSQSERKGGYHGWNGNDHRYFGKNYDPNDFGIYRSGRNYQWNPNWERDYYYRDPNIFQRYHGTDTISEKEILARGFSV